MRILVFGAAGGVGSRVVAEALSRGHDVTAAVRDRSRISTLPAGVAGQVGDVADQGQVATLAAGQDLVIAATRPPQGREHELADMARSLLAGTARAGVRLLLVGGAGSLTVPDTGGLLVDDPRYMGPAWRDIAVACCRQHDACRADQAADWTYASPPALLVPGERTGRYRLGGDTLLVDAEGRSAISLEDFAVAILDEAENPRHRRARFTVAY